MATSTNPISNILTQVNPSILGAPGEGRYRPRAAVVTRGGIRGGETLQAPATFWVSLCDAVYLSLHPDKSIEVWLNEWRKSNATAIRTPSLRGPSFVRDTEVTDFAPDVYLAALIHTAQLPPVRTSGGGGERWSNGLPSTYGSLAELVYKVEEAVDITQPRFKMKPTLSQVASRLNGAYDALLTTDAVEEAAPQAGIADIAGSPIWYKTPSGDLVSRFISMSKLDDEEETVLPPTQKVVVWYVPASFVEVAMVDQKVESCADAAKVLHRPGLFEGAPVDDGAIDVCMKEAKVRGLEEGAARSEAVFNCVARNSCIATGKAGARPFLAPFMSKRARLRAPPDQGIDLLESANSRVSKTTGLYFRPSAPETQGLVFSTAEAGGFGVAGCCARTLKSVASTTMIFDHLVAQTGTWTSKELDDVLASSKIPAAVANSMRAEHAQGMDAFGNEFRELLVEMATYWGATPDEVNGVLASQRPEDFSATDFSAGETETPKRDHPTFTFDSSNLFSGLDGKFTASGGISTPSSTPESTPASTPRAAKETADLKFVGEESEEGLSAVKTGTRLVVRILHFIVNMVRSVKSALSRIITAFTKQGLLQSGADKLSAWSEQWRKEATEGMAEEDMGVLGKVFNVGKIAASYGTSAVALLSKFVLWLSSKGLSFIGWMTSHPYFTRIIMQAARYMLRRGCRALSSRLYETPTFAVPLNQLASLTSVSDAIENYSEKMGALSDAMLAGVQAYVGTELFSRVMTQLGSYMGTILTFITSGSFGVISGALSVAWNLIWSELQGQVAEVTQGLITVFFSARSARDLLDIIKTLQRCLRQPTPILVLDKGRLTGRPRASCSRDADCAGNGCVEVGAEVAAKGRRLLNMYAESRLAVGLSKPNLRGAKTPLPSAYLSAVTGAKGVTALTKEQKEIYVALLTKQIVMYDAAQPSTAARLLSAISTISSRIGARRRSASKEDDDDSSALKAISRSQEVLASGVSSSSSATPVPPTQEEIAYLTDNVDILDSFSDATKTLQEAGFSASSPLLTRTTPCNVCASDGFCWQTHDPATVLSSARKQSASLLNTITRGVVPNLQAYVNRAYGLTDVDIGRAVSKASDEIMPHGNPVVFTPAFQKLMASFRAVTATVLLLERERSVREKDGDAKKVLPKIRQELAGAKVLSDTIAFQLSTAGSQTVASPEMKRRFREEVERASKNEKELQAAKAIEETLARGVRGVEEVVVPVGLAEASLIERVGRLFRDPREFETVTREVRTPLDLSEISVSRV